MADDDGPRWLSASVLSRPPSRAVPIEKIAEDYVTKQAARAADEILRDKEREIELLKVELKAERQILGRVGREPAEREVTERRNHELEKSEMEEVIWELKKQSVVDKYLAVEVAAGEAQRDIDAQKAMIRRLKEMLIV
jgi:hypothetical protein